MSVNSVFAKNDNTSNARLAAVKKLTDQTLLADIAKNDNDSIVRLAAVKKLTDQTLLADIAKNTKDPVVRLTTVKKLDAKTVLIDIAKVYTNKADIQYRQGDYAKAEEYYNKALTMTNETLERFDGELFTVCGFNNNNLYSQYSHDEFEAYQHNKSLMDNEYANIWEEYRNTLTICRAFNEKSDETDWIKFNFYQMWDNNVFEESLEDKFSKQKPYFTAALKEKIENAQHNRLSNQERTSLLREIAELSANFYSIERGKCIAIKLADGEIVETADHEFELLMKIQGKKFSSAIFVWKVGSNSFAGWKACQQ
jgi:tetratricopeptide (TPR) repeat protein